MASVEQRPAADQGPAGATSSAGGLLLNPRTYDPAHLDPESRRIMLATIEFFESRGKDVLKQHDRDRVWYGDFLDFVGRERIFATLLTPAAESGGDPDKRWDTARICAFNEITGFYGLAYWYT
jgi:acyl-CoA dehydrogenase